MKKVTKITGFFMLVLSLVVSMAGVAFASSTDFTGMKDDVYSAQTTPDAQGVNIKMNFTVEGGKVMNFTFAKYAGPNQFSESFLQAITDPKQNEGLQAILDETVYYNEQMGTVGDALKIPKYSKAANDDLYNAFQSLWKQLVAQGGGKIVEDAATTTSSSNPKTGDSGILVYVIAAGAALAGMAVAGRKRLTA